MTDSSEFPAFGRVAKVIDDLDGHRKRQVCAFAAARCGWNLKPATKKITRSPNPDNRSEFAAIETVAEELDQLTDDQQRQAVTLLAARYEMEITADYKPPSGGFRPKRSHKRG